MDSNLQGNKTVSNLEIAEQLRRLADILESKLDNPYRIRAYRRAANQIKKMSQQLMELIEVNSDLTEIHGIGKGIAYQIRNIIEGKDIFLSSPSPKKQIKAINELSSITGIGPKRLQILANKYNISTRKDLKVAIKNDTLRNEKYFNKKFLGKIKIELSNPKKSQRYFRLHHVIVIAENLLKHLCEMREVIQAELAGDYRRRVEIINDLVIIACVTDATKVIQNFSRFPYIKYILAINKKMIKVKLFQDLEITLKIVSEQYFGSELLYHTGSGDHLKKLEAFANRKKLKIHKIKSKNTEFSKNMIDMSLDEKNVQINQAEQGVYEKLGLSYIPPEIREDRGEFKLAKMEKLIQLVQLSDIKGDLHCHTNETDGSEDLETMVLKAIELGYEYIAISDHSQHLRITNGLDKKRLLRQIKQVDKLNEKLNNITILKSIEVDILENGKLDLPNSILKELDITTCSIHSKFRVSKEKQTDRIIRAMDNPYFNILGHATGRLIRRREPYLIDMPKILKAAKERNCFMELNSQPYRLDIKDTYCQLAKKYGVKIAISSDSHSLREFKYMQYGIFQARRGFLETEDVINTRNLKDLKKLLIKK